MGVCAGGTTARYQHLPASTHLTTDCRICCRLPPKHPAPNSRSVSPPHCSHKRTECDPANYDKVHRKPRCPVDGCNKKL